MDPAIYKLSPETARFAERHGFVRESGGHIADSFGDTTVVLRSPDCDLRITRDRGQVYFDVSPRGDADWHPLHSVLEFILHREFEAIGDQIINEFSNAYALVCQLLVDDVEKSGLIEFEKTQRADFARKLFPPRDSGST